MVSPPPRRSFRAIARGFGHPPHRRLRSLRASAGITSFAGPTGRRPRIGRPPGVSSRPAAATNPRHNPAPPSYTLISFLSPVDVPLAPGRNRDDPDPCRSPPARRVPGWPPGPAPNTPGPPFRRGRPKNPSCVPLRVGSPGAFTSSGVSPRIPRGGLGGPEGNLPSWPAAERSWKIRGGLHDGA